MAIPLRNLRVVDLTQGIAGPFCTMELGDLGAEVIKVEPLEGDYSRQLGPPFVGGESALFLSVNRNKKSLALRWEVQKGQDVIRRLVSKADIFLEDLKPGLADDLGLSYQELARVNRRLIYCSITPFGSEGSMSQQPGSELVAQGMSGLWRYLGNWGEPPIRIGQDMATTITGIFTFHGILAALYRRQETGEGQKVETSLLGSLSALKCIPYAAQSNPPEWSGHLLGPFRPSDHGYKTKDGAAYIQFGEVAITRQASGPPFNWGAFMKEVGMERHLEDPRFKSGLSPRAFRAIADEARHIFDEAFQKYTTEELAAIVSKYGGVVLPFNDYESLFKQPQIRAMEIVQEVEHPTAGKLKYVAAPWTFQKCDIAPSTPPPLLGQHTRGVLEQAGFSREEVQELFNIGLVGETVPGKRDQDPKPKEEAE